MRTTKYGAPKKFEVFQAFYELHYCYPIFNQWDDYIDQSKLDLCAVSFAVHVPNWS